MKRNFKWKILHWDNSIQASWNQKRMFIFIVKAQKEEQVTDE